MSDDIWRDRRDDDDFSEFGSLFDDAEPTQNIDETSGPSSPRREPDDEPLSFGDEGTGALPHWTEPPTGEIPRFDTDAVAETDHDDEELDVWSSFSSEAPVWKDDPTPMGEVEPPVPPPAEPPRRVTGEHRRVTGEHRRVTGEQDRVAREAGHDVSPPGQSPTSRSARWMKSVMVVRKTNASSSNHR